MPLYIFNAHFSQKYKIVIELSFLEADAIFSKLNTLQIYKLFQKMCVPFLIFRYFIEVEQVIVQ